MPACNAVCPVGGPYVALFKTAEGVEHFAGGLIEILIGGYAMG